MEKQIDLLGQEVVVTEKSKKSRIVPFSIPQYLFDRLEEECQKYQIKRSRYIQELLKCQFDMD